MQIVQNKWYCFRIDGKIIHCTTTKQNVTVVLGIVARKKQLQETVIVTKVTAIEISVIDSCRLSIYLLNSFI